MRQYEFAIRIAQIHHLVEERKFKKALAVIRTLDMKQVKNISDLTIIADVFAKTEQFDSAREAYLKIYNKSKTRRVVYRLVCIAIRTKELEDAEKYFHEFVQMNPNTRDVIILRYRIDKAAGVHIGKLIETLEELKEEEYIEEWAYELAKLYYKAGRFEECHRECEDILLWFGHGEIVERAKKLMEYVDDKEAMPYLDDKDYTVDRNEPNPDDTGSLPDLHEYLSNMKEEENRRKHLKERKAKEQEGQYTDKKEEDTKYKKEADTAVTKEQSTKPPVDTNAGKNNQNIPDKDGFIDDYEEDDFEIDAGFGKLAQKLTGLLHFGGKKDKKKETGNTDKDSTEPVSEEGYIIEDSGKADLDIKIRINKDLYNKTIAEAKNLEKENLEKEQQEKEENINPVKEEPVNVNTDTTENMAVSDETISENIKKPEPVYFQSGIGITQDLSREISAIYEAEHAGQTAHKEQLKETDVKVVDTRRPLKRDARKVIERMTKAVKSDENKNIHSASTEKPVAKPEEKAIEEPEKKIPEPVQPEVEVLEEKEQVKNIQEEIIVQPEEEIPEPASKTIMPIIPELEDGNIVVSQEEIELAEMEAKKAHEEAMLKAEEAKAIVEEARRKAEEAARMLAEIEKRHATAGSVVLPDNSQEKEEENNSVQEEPELNRDIQEEIKKDKPEENIKENIAEETVINEEIQETEVQEEIPQEITEDETKEDEIKEEIKEKEITEGEAKEEPESQLPEYEDRNYEDVSLEDEEYEEEWPWEEEYEEDAPVENVQEEGLSDDDLPTTRALHTSFDDILTLIGGEPDPSHFVFVGNTFDLITGLSKRIVKVMKDTGYMSIGRIARISAKNLNKMNLAEFKNQLKGNCLLIDEAAELMIPTIASIFEIMDEYYGDFVVIMADNGNTLDQLFKFAPSLAKRFKYIIDISGYTEEDCK